MDESTFKIKPHVLVYGKFKDPKSDSILLAYEHQITSLTENFPKGLSQYCLQVINDAKINKNETSGIVLQHYYARDNNIYIIFAKISQLYEVGKSGRRYTQSTVWVFEEEQWNIAYLSGCIDAITTEPNIKVPKKKQFVYPRQTIEIKKGDKVDKEKYPKDLEGIESALRSATTLIPNTEKTPQTIFISLLVQSLQELEQQVGAYAQFLSLAINIESKNYQILITKTQEKEVEYSGELVPLIKQLSNTEQLSPKPPIYNLFDEKEYTYNHYVIILNGGLQRTIDTLIIKEIKDFIDKPLADAKFPRISQLKTKKEWVIKYILESIQSNETTEETKLKSLALIRFTKGDISWDQAWVKVYQTIDKFAKEIRILFILRHQAIEQNILLKYDISECNFPTKLNSFKHLLKLLSFPSDFKDHKIEISDNHYLTHAFVGDSDDPYLFFKKVLSLLTSNQLWRDFSDLEALLTIKNPPKWFEFTLLKYSISWEKGKFIYHLHLFLLIGAYISKPEQAEKIRHITPELAAKGDFYAAILSIEKFLEKIKKLTIKQPALKIKQQAILAQINHLEHTTERALAIVDTGLKQDLFNQPLSIVEKGFLYLVIDQCIKQKQKKRIFPLFKKYNLQPYDINDRTADKIIQKI